MSEDDLEVLVNQKIIKKISAEDSMFGALSLELCTILKVLQESDQLTQKEQSQIFMASMTLQEMESN